jgi:CubicO group peptidase (beta-lactamase class C family)
MRLPVWLNILVLLSLTALSACDYEGSGLADAGSTPDGSTASTAYVYTAPDVTGDGWQTAGLAAEGFDAARIETMMTGIVNGEHPGIESVAIVRNGRLLMHWVDEDRFLNQYDGWGGNTRKDIHSLQSVTKSVTATLLGIAVDQGYIASTDVGFYSLFSYPGYAHWDDRKDRMTLDDALTMRLGLQWDEWSTPYTSASNSLAKLSNNSEDWAKALLDLPVYRTPGTVFEYNTAASTAIGQAIENATGVPLDLFADAYLFDPMQITTDRWAYSPTGLPIGGSGLFLSTRDLVKFGQLYLDGGTWHGRRLVSEDFVAASVTPWVDVTGLVTRNTGYGYQWWLGQLVYRGTAIDYWQANGYGGQYLFVVPSLDLVVAFAGSSYENEAAVVHLYMLMESYVLDAIA